MSQLEELLKDCHFLDLVERPGLWRTGFSWWVEGGKRPEARLTKNLPGYQAKPIARKGGFPKAVERPERRFVAWLKH
jgi:hypothetical protein